MTQQKQALALHKKWRGKIRMEANCPLETREDLALAYTPGVAEPCKAIAQDVRKSYEYTRRWNTVAVITDGTAVLGLGDIGPEAAMPVMEGKCALFKAFADIDAVPLCVRSKQPDEIVRTVQLLLGSFGAVNLEDIAAPRCFEIEQRLKEISDIPIFHDDQHGTAVVVAAGVLNALKVVGKSIETVRVVISGAGAAGIAVANLLRAFGVQQLAMADVDGPVYQGRPGMDPWLAAAAQWTNPAKITTSLADLMHDADIFVGVSAPGIVTQAMVRRMAKNPILFAMANPVPEIMPADAMAAGAAVVGTGRSDFDNQINNVIAYPGIFRGALDARASTINEAMKMAAARAIAGLVGEESLAKGIVIPDALDKRVAPAVAAAVVGAAKQSGVSRLR